MSLKARLRVSIVIMMTMLVLMQCVATLMFTIEDKVEQVQDRAVAIKDQTRLQVQQRISDQLKAGITPTTTFEETKALIQGVVAKDANLHSLLTSSIVGIKSVSEIQLCDDLGVILQSTTKDPSRNTFVSLPLFDDWRNRPLRSRIWEMMFYHRDYVLVEPLAIAGDPSKRILDIRIVVSIAYIRDEMTKPLLHLLTFSGLSLLATMVFAYLFSNVLLNWLNRLSQRIESITTGEFPPPNKDASGKEPKEFADMTSKLEVLSQQYRGAREDMIQLRRNIDGMLERLEEGVILFDSRGKVVSASRSAERILAYGNTQLVGRQMEDLFPPASPLGALLRSVLDRPRAVSEAAVRLDRGEAGPLRLLANVDLVDGPDSTQSLLLTLRDIEGRRQLRTQLDISTRLAAISGLTGGVAHEIKNPLNAMAVHLEVLKEKLAGEARVQNELGVIGGEIARLDRVVKTFLDFTRPVQLNLKRVDIVELARQVAALVWPGAERGSVSVELESKVSHAWARVDEDMIKQALINVVNNGVEAMKERGGRLRIAVDIEDEQVLIAVSDEGPGIPPDLRGKIFNLYFSTKEAGSGIGLAMTFRHIQLHNGTIDFTSDPLSGTTFRMRFPAVDDHLEAPGERNLANGTLGLSSALAVEPNEISGASAKIVGE